YGRPRADIKLYEFVWRIEDPSGSGATTHWFEGNAGSYYRNVRDRYGYGVIQNLSANGYSFDKSRRRTTWRAGLASGDWQTALVVEDKAGETRFLDKQRIILNPPVIGALLRGVCIRCTRLSNRFRPDSLGRFGRQDYFSR
ncbi:MAG: hypothetical protein ACYS0H_25755, partial [Planctomycetota bacterium]